MDLIEIPSHELLMSQWEMAPLITGYISIEIMQEKRTVFNYLVLIFVFRAGSFTVVPTVHPKLIGTKPLFIIAESSGSYHLKKGVSNQWSRKVKNIWGGLVGR